MFRNLEDSSPSMDNALLPNFDGTSINLGASEESSSTKTCTKCSNTKRVNLFHKKGLDRQGNPKHQSICKDCANQKRVARYKKGKSSKKTKTKSFGFDISSCEVELIYQDPKEPTYMKSVMNEYIEAVYAIPITKIQKSLED